MRTAFYLHTPLSRQLRSKPMMTLQYVKSQLEAVQGLSVSERGTGKGVFLFVRSAARAIEVYIEDSGYVVEYWDSADEESDDAPVNRDMVTSGSEALTRIKHWLCAHPKPEAN